MTTTQATANATLLPRAARQQTPESLWRRAVRRFLRHRLAVAAMIFLLFLFCSALFPQLITSFDPLNIVMEERLLGIAATTGILFGLLAGFFGGLVDSIIMRIMDVIFAFPAILLAIAIVALLGPSTQNVMIAIGIIYIPIFARIVRGSTLELRVQDYIEAAHASGAKSGRILWRHIFPGLMGPLTVQISLALADAILAEAALSFLGLGTQPPTPTWGSMLSFGREFIREAWWFSFFPGLAIFITVLSLNLVGDGWRDALDPRL